MAHTLTKEQALASDPKHSVWVTANAGTGKTKILTDRVLRLMLCGTPIHRILCLTFTNAAAAEMSTRINEELSKWAIASEEELTEEITILTDKIPDKNMLKLARQLFTQVVDNPDELKIQTIHGFCQSLLKRFPLEASITPHFTIIDDKSSQEILNDAWLRLLTNDNEENHKVHSAVSYIASNVADITLSEIIKELINNRNKILQLEYELDSIDNLITKTYKELGVKRGTLEADIIAKACQIEYSDFTILIKALADSKNINDNARSDRLSNWLSLPVEQRINNFDDYTNFFLTLKDLPRKNGIITQSAAKKSPPELQKIIEDEQNRLYFIVDKIKSLQTARMTESLLLIAESIFSIYKKLKDNHCFLDYNDLILYTKRLLSDQSIAPWVMYKLDGGIDHLLIDEAQDTSPEQWSIIGTLCDEFFSGSGQNQSDRTIFVVGDEKQSIFSFQGADPYVFDKMREYFAQTINAAKKSWQPVSLGLSFRSTAPILKVTDEIFKDDEHKNAITAIASKVSHTAHRASHAGIVELWPLVKSEPKESSAWQIPIIVKENSNSKAILADRIAKTIRKWLDEKRILKSKNRPITTGDILILVRRRNDLVDSIISALVKYNIAVAGIDRMKLNEHICVMDLIALGKFLLLPTDDLTLANILKSPLINFSEDELFALAYGRGKVSLWQRLCNKQDDPTYRTGFKFLQDLLNKVDFITPFELYSHIIEVLNKRQEFVARMGTEVNDPLDEFINLTADYSNNHTSSLQGFIHWLEYGDTIIKRDLEQGKDEIRIMTIHGSKGLQAPIVFMPDTHDIPKNNSKLLWDENGIMFWTGKSENRNEKCQNIADYKKQQEYNEYLRLFYVALTRAEDELYICGYQGKNKISDKSWYAIAESKISKIAKPVENMFGDDAGLQLKSEQNAIVKTSSNKDKPINDTVTLPDFAITPAPDEPIPPSPLAPSHIEDSGTSFNSPLNQSAQFQRGNLIHHLLEILPNIAPEKHIEAANKIAENYPKHIQKGTIDEVLQIINNPEFSDLFSQNSQAEIAISGIIDGQVINGQVDRIVVSEDKVLIIDYKTNQQPPKDNSQIPKQYQKQMQAYHAILSQIYPDSEISCFLLWTANMQLMEVNI